MMFIARLRSLRSALSEAPFFYRLIASVIAGVGLSFIQAPYDLWFLLFPCFGLFYFLYGAAINKKQVFLTAFVFALSYFFCSLNWIGNALLVEGNEYKWVWPLAVIALPTLLALFTALYVTIAHILFQKNTLSGFIGFCVLFTLSEYVRGYAFTGFPWNLYGYGWASVLPMIQSLSLFGPYGLTFFSIFWGCSLGYLSIHSSRKIICLLLVIFSLGAIYFYGTTRYALDSFETVDDLAVHIIQPNIEQSEKWKPEKIGANFEKHIALSSNLNLAQKNIFIWPETALSPALLKIPAVRERIKSVIGTNGILLSGALKVQENPLSYYNALMLWDQDRPPQHLYSKSHLVPFGEYIPFQKYIPIETISGFSGFTKGDGPQTIGFDDYPSLSALICYEVIFPNHAVNAYQARPDYILTITNDAWYGDSPGPYQHFQQARYRAIEQGLPVIRSANTGISGLIDPYGRVIRRTKLMEDATITLPLPRRIEKTYYSIYGDKPFLIFIFLCLLFSIAMKNRLFS